MSRLVIVAHGIGDHQPDFWKEWEEVIRAGVPGDYEVAGLYWEDLLQKVAEKYPIVSRDFADAVARYGFSQLQELLGNDTFRTVSDYFMDVLVYTAMGDMTEYLQTTCAIRLKQLIQEKGRSPSEVILIGHSLGGAMLPHLVWR